MKFKNNFDKIIFLVVSITLVGCSMGEMEDFVRDFSSERNNNGNNYQNINTQNNSNLNGKWYFSVLGERGQLACTISLNGSSGGGSCSKGSFGSNSARLSVFDHGSYLAFNLIDKNTNRMVAGGRLYPENSDYFSGNCNLIFKNGSREDRECVLSRYR